MAHTGARAQVRIAHDASDATGRDARAVRAVLPRVYGRLDDTLGDDGLITQARAGSGEAFEELWRRHAEAGRRVAARFTQSSEPDDLVQEAYLRIYTALQNGKGPDVAFRPYLYQTIRNIAITWSGRPVEQSISVLAEMSDGTDMMGKILEDSLTAKAFRSLPGRWQSVLWYSEVEGLEPAEIAPLLGITSGAVSALAYRAREGLRRAWLQMHVNSDSVPPECTWAAERMGDFNRGALRRAPRARFDAHVTGCTRCMVLVDEVSEVSRKLGLVMVPIVVGVPWGTFAESESEAEAAASPDATLVDDAARRAAEPRPKRSWAVPAVAMSVLALVIVLAGAVVNTSWFATETVIVALAPQPAQEMQDPGAPSTDPALPADPPTGPAPARGDGAPGAAAGTELPVLTESLLPAEEPTLTSPTTVADLSLLSGQRTPLTARSPLAPFTPLTPSALLTVPDPLSPPAPFAPPDPDTTAPLTQ